eukprot:6205316-Pleurochrysis_carterae.AAC.3
MQQHEMSVQRRGAGRMLSGQSATSVLLSYHTIGTFVYFCTLMQQSESLFGGAHRLAVHVKPHLRCAPHAGGQFRERGEAQLWMCPF